MSVILEYSLAMIVALLSQNVSEWFVHKFILHKLGANKKSFFHYHWEHHHRCRKLRNIDPEYVQIYKSHGITKMLWKEIGMMLALSLLLGGPIYFFTWKALGVTTVIALWFYFLAHAYSHINPEWSKKFMPWHYDHHMGKDQNQNWCVTFPWFDWVMGTRKTK